MDPDSSQPGTPVGGPLQALTQDRVNQQRDSITSVHDKISQFNSMSITAQSRQLERKTADAALKRAMLGREEAEADVRRSKDEIRAMRKAIEEGKERERRVGERLETIMVRLESPACGIVYTRCDCTNLAQESYGRAKETHAHTQALWEKEIRRARKENFKTQSSIVKLQEELKAARTTTKSLDEAVGREKERTRVREQEAFTARYQIVGVQEQLEQALAQIKLVEQERDAFKTAAKNEEVARIAAEGRLPLPSSQDPNDEFASPPKKGMKKRKISREEPRYSLSTMEIESSAATEMEIEELTLQVQWERQRAERAEEMVDFLKAECEMHCCPCSKNKTKQVPESLKQEAKATFEEHLESAHASVIQHEVVTEEPDTEVPGDAQDSIPRPSEGHPSEPETAQPETPVFELKPPKSKKEPRRSTIFCPKEGIFRTVSEYEAAAMEAQGETDVIVEHAPVEIDTEPPTPVEAEAPIDHRMYARTPSAEPPTFALLAQERTSLLSLLNAPHNDAHTASMSSVPMVSDIVDDDPRDAEDITESNQPEEQPISHSFEPVESPEPRPHTSATLYNVTTTTVPVRDENEQRESSASFGEKLRTPSSSSNASFDLNNPALTPTMTREQALAKIRERRGRAKSAAQGAATPHKKMIQGKERRDMSAPTGKAGNSSSRSRS